MSYNYIAQVTLSSNASEIAFTSIPATYTDLLIKLSGKTNINGDVDGVSFDLNGTQVSASNNGAQRQNSYGSGAGAERNNYNGTAIPGNGTGLSNIFGDAEIYIPSYARATGIKTLLSDSSTSKTSATYVFQSNQEISSSTSAAINAITIKYFDSGGSQFLSGTTAYLYGIKNS
jgi:hypothetical protein